MGKLIHSFGRGDFLSTSSYQCKLSILIGVDSFDYMVFDDKDQPKIYRSHAFDAPFSKQTYQELDRFFSADDHLSRTFQSVAVCTDAPFFTIVPERLYKESNQKIYLEQLVRLDPGYSIKSDRIRRLPAFSVYAVNAFVSDWSLRNFPMATHRHISSALTGFLLSQYVQSKTEQVFMHLQDKHLLVFAFRDQQLLLANAYSLQQPEQLLYYVALVFNQLHLDQKMAKVFLSGNIRLESSWYKVIRRYIADLEFVTLPGAVNLEKEFQKLPDHHYWALFGPLYQ